jgi:hypothetical protein
MHVLHSVIYRSIEINNNILAAADLCFKMVICPEDRDSKNLRNIIITVDI